MIFQAFFQSAALANPFLELILIASLAVFALTSALAAACFVKAFGITFLALPRSDEAKEAKESPKLMIIGPAILAALCIALGIFSLQIFGILGFSFPLPNMLFIGAILAGFYVFTYAALREFARQAGKNCCRHGAVGSQLKPQRWSIQLQASQSQSLLYSNRFSEPEKNPNATTTTTKTSFSRMAKQKFTLSNSSRNACIFQLLEFRSESIAKS